MLSRTRTATRPIRGLAGVQTASKRISPHSSVVVLRSAGTAAAVVLDKRRNSSSFARGSFTPPVLATTTTATGQPQRGLSGTAVRRKGQVKPFVLADIGEGITECEIVKWCVKSLAYRVLEFSRTATQPAIIKDAKRDTIFHPFRRNAVVHSRRKLDDVQLLINQTLRSLCPMLRSKEPAQCSDERRN